MNLVVLPMNFRSIVLSALLLGVSSAEDKVSSLPPCQRMTVPTYEKYHAHGKCNHAWQNSEERRLQRTARHDYMARTGSYPLIPNQRTVVCPTEPADLSSDVGALGLDTRWVVENKSSGKVVIAYVENGIEYSAMNGKVTPPQADPQAILQPGEYKVVNTHEGHVFYVRLVMEDGSTGDILLQHRPGIVEFTNRFGKDIDCGKNVMQYDEDTLEEIIQQNMVAHEQHTNINILNNEASNAARVEPSYREEQMAENAQATAHPSHHCNMIYQGFRNTLPNCPLDIYYAGVEQGISDGPMQCAEKLKFHLGNKALNCALEREARLKFELTFIGHTFVARLASNPNIVVDSFTLAPTEIHDCPSQKQKVETVEQVIESNGVQSGNANLQNSTTTLDLDTLSAVLPCNSMFVNGMSS